MDGVGYYLSVGSSADFAKGCGHGFALRDTSHYGVSQRRQTGCSVLMEDLEEGAIRDDLSTSSSRTSSVRAWRSAASIKIQQIDLKRQKTLQAIDLQGALTNSPAHASFKVKGGQRRMLDDLTYLLLRSRNSIFGLLLVTIYATINLVFGALYFAGGPNALTDGDGSFRDAFCFSVITLSTIGYGHRTPASSWVDAVVVVEAMTSIVFISLIGGLTFSRILRPSSRMVFANQVVVAPLNGVHTLRLRLCNERPHSVLYHASFYLTVSFERVDREGHRMRIQRQLKLLQDTVPVLGATFTVCHRIDEQSPLHGLIDEKTLANFSGA